MRPKRPRPMRPGEEEGRLNPMRPGVREKELYLIRPHEALPNDLVYERVSFCLIRLGVWKGKPVFSTIAPQIIGM